MWEPASFLRITQGLPSSPGRSATTARASGPSGTTGPPVVASDRSMQSSLTYSQRRNRITEAAGRPGCWPMPVVLAGFEHVGDVKYRRRVFRTYRTNLG